MKVLLDEQLPVKLKYRLQPEIEVSTVRDESWLGIKNGSLILLAFNSGFTVFITNDKDLGFQQKLNRFKILFINVNQPSNRYEELLPVIFDIKKWLLKNNTEVIINKKNYLIFPEDLLLIQ
jgi:hypothetical protein